VLLSHHQKCTLIGEITGYCIDVAVISQTLLKKKHVNERFSIDGYDLFRRGRLGRRGGGVTIYARHDLLATEWTFQVRPDPSFELLWIKISTGQSDVFTGALYHPPNPQYQSSRLLDYMEVIANELNCSHQGALVIVAGDFNTLSDIEYTTKRGFLSVVDQPTRGSSLLDETYVSESYYEQIKVVNSSVKSDHTAIVAYNGNIKTAVTKSRTAKVYRKVTPAQHASFLSYAK